MGRGRSKIGPGMGGGPAFKGVLDLGGDDSNIEFDGTLRYGKDDKALDGQKRIVVEEWEKKRVTAKVEYAYAVDGNGNPVGPERRGGKGSVRTPYSYHNQEDGAFTHIHPRDPGVLGGTFSSDDLYNFSGGKSKTTRAAAKEGTYSISKKDGFDAKGFNTYIRECNKKFNQEQRDAATKLGNEWVIGNLTGKEFRAQGNKAFNTCLVNLHNAYAAGQKKYGYTYTLEKRK